MIAAVHAPSAPRVARRGGLVASLAVALCACSLLGGAASVVLPPDEGTAPALLVELTVRPADVTGLELPTEAVLAAFRGAEGANRLVGRPSAVLVSWVGGACDERAEIAVGRAPAGALLFAVRSWSTNQPCEAIGVMRSVIVTFAAAVEGPMGMQQERCLVGRPDCR